MANHSSTLKKRLIPVLFLKNGLIVRSQNFVDFREFGNPINQLERLNSWGADELIYIDISRGGVHDLRRDEHKVKNLPSLKEILVEISKHCFMPLTFGGRIATLSQAAEFITHGADKVIVNTNAYKNPHLVSDIVKTFGSQCMVVGIDVKKEGTDWKMYIDQGRERVSISPVEWARRAEDLGAGEIFLNSIDRDGTSNGFDLEIIEKIASAVSIPVIACGGAGQFEDFVDVMQKTSAAAVAAGNIFNFSENAYLRAKKELIRAGCLVRASAETKTKPSSEKTQEKGVNP